MSILDLHMKELRQGEDHDDIDIVRQFLHKYGYLRGADPKGRTFDPITSEAVAKYQEFFGLPVSGNLDSKTIETMKAPRCGVPDIPPRAFLDRRSPFESTYQSFRRFLTYGWEASTGDLSVVDQRAAVRRALATWENAISIDYAEVDISTNPTLRFGWFEGDHGDNAPFDGRRGTLAHAYFPPPAGGAFAGRCHFDDAEDWVVANANGGNSFDVEAVTLHEIGHLLGFGHTQDPSSVMFANYNGLRQLSQTDLDLVAPIYGRRSVTLSVLVHLQDTADITAIENEFAGTRGESRRLEGFSVSIAPQIPGLSCRYFAHLQDTADTDWVGEGNFVGTRGESRRLEGFAVELTGPRAAEFSVVYMAHLQDTGDTGYFRDGQFCGTRGESRRLEGLLIRIEPRN